MPVSPDELFAYLDSLGIAHKTVSHPPVFTVEEARALRGQVAGGHTKNLFLRDKKGALFLVVALEDAAIELKSLHRLLGASGRFSFGSAELLRETLGVEPGAVTPFAAINDTRRPGDRHPRCRHDGARCAQLSPAGEQQDDDDLPRGPGQIPRRHRTSAAHRGGCRCAGLNRDCIRPGSPHLSGE